MAGRIRKRLQSWQEWQEKKSNPVVETKETPEEVQIPTDDPTTVRINEATIEDLRSVKGIGPKIAEKIKKNGPYKELTDLSKQAEITDNLANRVIEWAS